MNKQELIEALNLKKIPSYIEGKQLKLIREFKY